MPETGFTDGDVVTAAQLNQIEDQQVTTCTSSTRPTAVEGRYIYETDTNQMRVYNGSVWVLAGGAGWVTFTPSWGNVTLGGSPTNVGKYCYTHVGIRVRAQLTLGTSGAPTGSVTLTVPNSETMQAGGPVALGVAQFKDAATDYDGTARISPGTTVIGLFSGTNDVTATNPFTFGVGDQIIVDIVVPL